MKRVLTIILMTAACICLSSEVTSITTAKGKAVKGTFKVQSSGVFHVLPTGGKLYRWDEIKPDSLPEDVREAQRRRLVKTLIKADAYYRKNAFSSAKPLFKEVYRHRNYLRPEDEKRREYANLSMKADGLVEYEGEFMTFAQRQKKRGYVLHKGKWIRAERLSEDKAFRDAFWEAREGKDPVAAIKQLQALIEKYPKSKRRDDAESLIEKLRDAEEQPREEIAADLKKELPPPKIDDYYVDLKGDIDKIRTMERPEMPSPVYPEAGKTGFPYHKEEDVTGYYIPKYTRDKDGFYHYSINGIKFKSRRPPGKVRIKK